MAAISFRNLLQALSRSAGRFLAGTNGASPARPGRVSSPVSESNYAPLSRVTLTDEVNRTLFEEYAAHRESSRGEEETGWVLLGLRRPEEAVILATLPAGANRSASNAHVRFDSSAQALASRVVRQESRGLTLLGVLHTHPGSMRHPSDGDYRGDIEWVAQLRGGEGVFGIGTADARPGPEPGVAWQPKPNVQCLGKLCLSWYALGKDDRNYRPVSVEMTIGPDLARTLRLVWGEIEAHAERLDRLARQQNRVRFDVVAGQDKPALAVTVPLADPGRAVQAVLEGKEVRYFLLQGDDLMAATLQEPSVDRGVYLLLAELANRS